MGDPRKFHPLTGALIVPVGYRKDGRAIWPVMGASDDPPPADPPPSDPPPADPPVGDDPPSDPDDGKGGKDAILADLAKERDKRQALERTVTEMQTAHQAQMDALAKAFGLKSDDDPPDAEALTAQVQAEQAKAREAALQLAVFRAAPQHEANASRLLDSASFLASLKEVDPTDADAVGNAIKAAVEADEMFKATPAPTTPPFPGGPRSSATPRAGSLGEAIANKLAATRTS